MLNSLNEYEKLRTHYDNICYITYLNIRSEAEKATRIVFRNLDYSNKEHKFVIAVAKSCWSILGQRDFAVDCNFIDRLRIANKCKNICKVGAAKRAEDTYIDVPVLLDTMREYAYELCGPDFSFGNIYEEYYEE